MDYTEPSKTNVTYDEPNESGWFNTGWFNKAWFGRKTPTYTEPSKGTVTYTEPEKGD